MRFYLMLAFVGMFSLNSMAQKDYPSLLWEITKDDQKKPSYLYGTMHVSSKIAFSLSDSFFVALKNVDVVALESDPSKWMDEMEEMDMLGRSYDWDNSSYYEGDFYSNAFPIILPESKDYAEMLRFEPSIVNGLLYRISGFEADFEEDTYLDLFIFQAGNKLGKKVMDLEDFKEVQELSDKAEKEARKEKFKQSPFGYDENPYEIIEESYRKGDLDMLDSIMMQLNSESYNKYMLFERNENMAQQMDSIMSSGSSLFTGIGAAHLAGEQGVIEMMREKGYTCRPILKHITDASLKTKKKIDKSKVQLTYDYQYPSDSTFRIKLPGKLYELPMAAGKQTYIHPEMVNGSNYSVVRIKTFNAFTGFKPDYIIQTVDSLLFENIPGEIIKETRINIQGHPGFDILNKTRRGDYQRYHIIALPNELLVFKLKGSRKFAKTKEASRFFESIEFLKPNETSWKNFEPKSKEFTVKVPGSTNESSGQSIDGHINLQTFDPSSGDFYMIQRNVLHDFRYIEEDKFELEYFMESIAKQNEMEIDTIYSVPTNSYPVAQGELLTKTGKRCFIQTTLRGAQYYLILQVSNSGAKNTEFFDSFALQDPSYEDFELYSDTTMFFDVQTIKMEESVVEESNFGFFYQEPDEDMDMSHLPESHEKEFFCEETGESIYLSYYKYHKYRSEESEAEYKKDALDFSRIEDDFMVNGIDSGYVSGHPYVEFFLTDTNSIRSIHFRSILKNSTSYSIIYQSDTLTKKSKFIQSFFDTFSLQDTSYTSSLFVNKADTLFNDIWGSDTTKVRQAVTSLSRVYFQDENADDIIKCIEELSHKEFELSDKLMMVEELGRIENDAIVPYLHDKYIAVDDSSTWQLAILNALSRQETVEATKLFRDLILLETPFSKKSEISPIFRPYKDSLELAVHLFPEILEISRIDEYQEPIYELLARLKDNDFISENVYKPYLKDIKWEARNKLKRLLSSEEEEDTNSRRRYSDNFYNDYRNGNYYQSSNDSLRKFYNNELATFNSLLYPFKETDKRAKQYFEKQSRIKDESQILLLAGMDLIQGEELSDSLLCKFCESDKTRADFLELTENFNISFNDSCMNQQSLARSILFKNTEEKDSVTFIQSDTVTVKGQTGIIYFFKSFNSYNETWKLSYLGLFSKDDPSNLDYDLNLKGKSIGLRATTEEEKIKEIIEDFKLYGRKRADKKSQGFEDYYFYD